MVISRTLVVAAALTLPLALAGCGKGGHSTPPTTPPTTAPAPTTTTTTPAPATTVYTPSAPQSSPDDAAGQLVQLWASGNRSGAASIASPAAVASLFAAPYPGAGLAIDRGCGDTPMVCTFGPPGGANPNDAIYELFVNQTAKGWYVGSVTVEG